MSRSPLTRVFVVALAALAAATPACGQSGPDPVAVPKPDVPASVTLDLARKDLVFRYLDPHSGEVATAASRDAIPAAARGQVVVYDDKAAVPPGWDLVADLSKDGASATAVPRQSFAFTTRAALTPSREAPSAAGTAAPGTHEVVMFSSEGCGYCAKARKFMTEQRIPFTELDIEEDPAAPARLQALAQKAGLGPRDMGGVPIIFVDGQAILGWDQRRLARLLGLTTG